MSDTNTSSRPKLGKKPARENAVTFKLERYLLPPRRIPTPPQIFGDEDLIGNDWGALGNVQYGDCVWAGAAHETMLWNKEAGRSVAFNDGNALADYSAVTGFDPANPDSDQGTDMQQAASYRRTTGVIDATGTRHKIVAYLSLRKGDFDQLILATYLFGAAGVGFIFPDSAWEQFDHSAPWDVVAGSSAKDGHYVPAMGRDADGNLVVVTWGKQQRMTPAFYRQYNDETIAYVSDEFLMNGLSRHGFDLPQLLDDLKQLH